MIVYLHGFSSAADSRKANYLKQTFKNYDFYVPDYSSHQPRVSISFLQAYIEQLLAQHGQQKVMLIGSSLGGYYAQYLGSTLGYIDGAVLINPALQAQSILAPHIGEHENMVSGERFEFTQADCDELALFDVSSTEKLANTLVLLDEGDELIDHRFAIQRYQEIGRVIIYPGGSHWFEHLDEAIPEIATFYQSIHQ